MSVLPDGLRFLLQMCYLWKRVPSAQNISFGTSCNAGVLETPLSLSFHSPGNVFTSPHLMKDTCLQNSPMWPPHLDCAARHICIFHLGDGLRSSWEEESPPGLLGSIKVSLGLYNTVSRGDPSLRTLPEAYCVLWDSTARLKPQWKQGGDVQGDLQSLCKGVEWEMHS